MRRLGLAFAATGLAACATPARLPPRASLDQGLLIARVEAHGALFHRWISSADSATIVALDAEGVPVPGKRAISGRAVNGYVVFFGMPAGRYVLRSASLRARGVRYELLAPKSAESKRAVVLRPGTVAYLGDYGFDSIWPESDIAWARAGRIIAHWLTPFLKRPLLPRDAEMNSFAAGVMQETQALFAVREVFSGTQWSGIIAARLRELSAAEPAKVGGAFISREFPLHEEPFLSWRDTLKWGEPRRVPSGIAWRRPGGEAQIAVFFTTTGAAGFLGWAESVSELRRSASASVMDSGGVYEIQVATRTGLAVRTTKYKYPEGVLVGSETAVILTETTLVPDGYGLYTARLRAPKGQFDAALPAYREFLLQLVLGAPQSKAERKPEVVMPFLGESP